MKRLKHAPYIICSTAKVNLWTLSRITHDWLCRCGHSRSWCACAYDKDRRWFVALADRLFHRLDGPEHCKRSADYYAAPVHFTSTDAGFEVTQDGLTITIPNRLRIAAIKEIASGMDSHQD